MSEHSSFAKGLITVAAFVIVVTGIKMAETLIVPSLLAFPLLVFIRITPAAPLVP